MTIATANFERCYKASTRGLKRRNCGQPTGHGPSISIAVFLAQVKVPDIRSPADWRNLGVVLEICDNGTRFDVEKYYFSGDPSSSQYSEDLEAHAESILRGTVQYLNTLFYCPDHPTSAYGIFGSLLTKCGPIEMGQPERVLEYSRNAQMKPYIKKVLTNSHADQLWLV